LPKVIDVPDFAEDFTHAPLDPFNKPEKYVLRVSFCIWETDRYSARKLPLAIRCFVCVYSLMCCLSSTENLHRLKRWSAKNQKDSLCYFFMSKMI
jgi:hypothetical protein